MTAVREIVRRATHEYNRQRVSIQPSASAVDEATRPKGPSPSGRLLLRMPPGLHGELARAAENEGTSLNGYIISRLTESVGWTPKEEEHTDAQRVDLRGRLTWLLAANVAAVALAAAAAVAILLVAWFS